MTTAVLRSCSAEDLNALALDFGLALYVAVGGSGPPPQRVSRTGTD